MKSCPRYNRPVAVGLTATPGTCWLRTASDPLEASCCSAFARAWRVRLLAAGQYWLKPGLTVQGLPPGCGKKFENIAQGETVESQDKSRHLRSGICVQLVHATKQMVLYSRAAATQTQHPEVHWVCAASRHEHGNLGNHSGAEHTRSLAGMARIRLFSEPGACLSGFATGKNGTQVPHHGTR